MQPKTLYHYTSIDALNGIIAHNGSNNILRLWGTEHNFMNDPKEIIRGRKLLMGNFIPKIDDLSLRQELLESYLSEKAIYYISSLSNKIDALPMWSAYGQNGFGICLEFDTQVIIEDKGEYFISKCIYSDKELLEEIDKAIVAKSAKEQRSICLGLAPNCMLLKPAYYNYEDEYRIMFFLLPDEKSVLKPKMRLNRGQIVRYIEYDLPIDALKSITIGPNNNMQKVHNNLKQYLRHRGLENVRIKRSKIPYKTR